MWWVRYNAAHALQKLGKEGMLVLAAQDPQLDFAAYETALHVLQTPITKQQGQAHDH